MKRKSCSGTRIQIDDETTIYTLQLADHQVVIEQDRDDLELKIHGKKTDYHTMVSQCKCKEGGNDCLENAKTVWTCSEYIYSGQI